MARAINRLTTKGIAALKEPGFYADGGGLYLRIDQTLNRRWAFVYFWAGKRREMGLGSASTTELKDVRGLAEDARRLVAAGVDPIAARKVEAAKGKTFGEAALEVIADMAPGWTSDISERQWTQSLKEHAKAIWRVPVQDVGTEQVLAVLTPIWPTKPETASRVRSRIERVLAVAVVKGWRQPGENPARWANHLQLMLPRMSRLGGHHTAMPYEKLPAFLKVLRERPATAARALEFAILTGGRTTEVREAVWSEVEDDLWVIPAERMKMAREHRVPLSERAVAILEEMRPLRTKTDLIFPGDQRIEPLSRMAMLMLLRRMKVDVTVHGFRSTFRDWAGDCTQHDEETVEQALAHVVGGKVRRAYRRRDALEKRRALMDDWAKFCASDGSNVVHLKRA